MKNPFKMVQVKATINPIPKVQLLLPNKKKKNKKDQKRKDKDVMISLKLEN